MSTVDGNRVDKAVDESVAAASWVYFIVRDGYVKIGTTRNASKRLSEFQVASPYPVRLAGVIPGNAVIEASLHERWREYQVRGEWFRLAKPIREFIGQFARTEDKWRANSKGAP